MNKEELQQEYEKARDERYSKRLQAAVSMVAVHEYCKFESDWSREYTIRQMEGEWISVEDRLPKHDSDILIYCSGDKHFLKGIKIGYHSYCFHHEGWEITSITHWRELPSPPITDKIT